MSGFYFGNILLHRNKKGKRNSQHSGIERCFLNFHNIKAVVHTPDTRP